MKKSPRTALDQLLCERIEAVVARHTGGTFHRERVLAAVREVLDSARLERDEEALLAKKRAEGLAGQALLDCLIGARIEHALTAGLDAAVGVAGSAELRDLPQVVVLRGELARAGIELAGPSGRPDERADPAPTLILTDDAALRDLHGELTVTLGAREVELRFPEEAGASANGDDAGGEEATLTVGPEVLERASALAELERTLGAHVLERGDARARGLGSGSGARRRDDLTGATIAGKYEVVRMVGRGGFGAVYEARDTMLGSRVAIKVLNQSASRTSADLEAFKEEARRLTQLDHPNIVGWKVFDEMEDGTLYFVMEYIDGPELEDVLKREKRLDPKRAGRLLLQILQALQAAHHVGAEKSILHLDLKPQNIFVVPGKRPHRPEKDERAKVIDFGIGQVLGGERERSPRAVATDARDPGGGAGEAAARAGDESGAGSSSGLGSDLAGSESDLAGSESDLAGSEIGGTMVSVRHSALARELDLERSTQVTRCNACTPEYASPEQCAHMDPKARIEPLDGRSDLYSVGVIGFRMLTGELPFAKPKKRRAWLRLHREEQPRRVRELRRTLPFTRGANLAEFVERCLRKDPDERFADTNAALEALDLVVHPPAWKQSLQVALPALLAAGAWFAWTETLRTQTAGLDVRDAGGAGIERVYTGPNARPVLTVFPKGGGERGLPRDAELALVPAATSAPLDWLEPVWADAQPDRPQDASEAEGAGGELSGESAVRTVTLRDVRDGPRASGEGYLEVRVGRRRLVSDAIRFVHLGPDDWSLGPPGVAGLGQRALDPRGAVLALELENGRPEDIERLEARGGSGDPTETAPVRAGPREGGRFEVPLGALGLEPSGGGRVVVEAFDRAGNSKSAAFVPPGGLALEALALAGEVRVPRYVYSDGRVPIAAAFTGPVDATVRARERRGSGEERPLFAQPLRASGESLELGLDLARPYDYEGEIVLEASDAAYVLRADEGRGTLTVRFPFVYTRERPRLSLSVGGRAAGPDGPILVGGTDALARATNDSKIPLFVEFGRSAPSGRELAFGGLELQPGESTPDETRWRLAEEGLHELSLRAARTRPAEPATALGSEGPLAPGSPDAGELDFEARFTCLVDASAPELSGLAPRLFAADREPGTLALEVRDAGTRALRELRAGEAAIRLTWQLARRSASGAPLAGALERALERLPRTVADESLAIPLGPLFEELPGDGVYALSVEAEDPAGQRSAPLHAEWTLARDAPAPARPGELFQTPARLGRWMPEGDGRWWVRAALSDPNGIERVECAVYAADSAGTAGAGGPADLEPRTLELTDPEGDGTYSAWLAFGHPWSERSIALELRARDAAGNLFAPPPEVRPLPLIVRRFPERVTRRGRARDASAMRHVEGNRAFAYRFKGEDDRSENKRFAQAGLGSYAESGEQRSWSLSFEHGAIPDFYMDEHEVSRGQYLAFLLDEGGFRDARHWPAGERPDEARRAELAERFEAEPELPATGVTFAEAWAYAHWAGKRLPTYVEWEYAVRGGSAYRPYSTWTPGREEPPALDAPEPEIRVAPAFGAPARLRPVLASRDVTPDTGIRDLCGNAAEWTATPYWFGDGRPANLREHAELNRERLLAIPAAGQADWDNWAEWASQPVYWVAGGSCAYPGFHFARNEQLARGESAEHVGFRCALDAARAVDADLVEPASPAGAGSEARRSAAPAEAGTARGGAR